MATQYLFLLYSLLLSTVSTAYATQVMRRPAGYNGTVNVLATAENSTSHNLQKRATSKVSFGYFTNWGIYKANFHPNDIVTAPLTHILYAFADTDASTGAIKLTDSYADESKRYPGDSGSAGGNNLYGCLKQLYLLKLKQRNLKVLLSIGGWTYSKKGHFNFITNPSSRVTFVANAVRLIEDYGFDGIDIVYEYPSNSAQGQGLADLLTELRKAFNTLKGKKKDSTPYVITVAVPAVSKNHAYYKIPQMNSAIDYWNLMAYDYAGPWFSWADNIANVYGGLRTEVQTDSALNWYIAQGVSSDKITLGMPLYGRAFENTEGPETPYHGVGPGTIEPGVYAYKNLPFAGAQVSENEYYLSSFSYDPVKKEFVSYDTPHIVSQKVQYLFSKGLAGTMFWELSSDKVGSDSLVGTAAGILGSLDQTPNHIHYPNSKWDNVKNNMGQKITNTPSSLTLCNPSKPSPKSAPDPKSCTGVAAWSSAIAYTGGAKVTHDNHLWVAKRQTQASAPGGQTDFWTDEGKC